MADRKTLHKKKLGNFRHWLVTQGWEIRPTSRNPYEVLRATKPGRTHPLIVYEKANAEEHLSVTDRDYPVVIDYLKSCKEPCTRGERIREMENVELARQLTEIVADALTEYAPERAAGFEKETDEKKRLEWLNSKTTM